MQETFTLLSHHSDHFSLLAESLNNNQTNTENETYMLDNKLPEWATDVTGNRMCSVMQLAYNDYGQHDHSQLQLLAVTLYFNVEAVLRSWKMPKQQLCLSLSLSEGPFRSACIRLKQHPSHH